MKETVIYLSGAMEAYDGTDKAKEWRERVKEFFSIYCTNVRIISPVDFYSYDSNYHQSEFEVFRFDLRKTKEADVILVNLNDIRKSIGSVIELYEAYKNGSTIIGFLDDEPNIQELIKQIHPWVYCMCDRIETGNNSMERAMYYIKDYCL